MIRRVATAFSVIFAITVLGGRLPITQSFAESVEAPWERVEVVRRAEESSDRGFNSTINVNSISNITVYVTSFCDDCDKVTRFLKQHDLIFDEKFIVPKSTILGGLLNHEPEAPITRITYSDGSSRRITGFDRELLGVLIKKDEAELPADDSFEISEFELP